MKKGFLDYIKDSLEEAALDIDTISKNTGKSAGDYLVDVFNEFGSDEWTTRSDKKFRSTYGTDIEVLNIRKLLVKKGYLTQLGLSRKITQNGIDYVNKKTGSKTVSTNAREIEQEDDEDLNVAKGVKDVSNLKVKKFIVPKVGTNSRYLDQMKTILTHMKGFAEGSSKTTFMLGGDPGTGKTSFIKSLSTITGIPLVIIEAPHITQEHLINIPFLVIDGHKERQGNLTIDDSSSQMKVVQAESNLVTQLKSKKKRTPDEIQREIKKSKVLRDIYPQLERRINKIAGSYNAILFLDEFYRTSSMKIRNVLRNILNGKIGNDKIPAGVYIVMATNINDEGVEEIPLNQDFHLMDYDVSSKEDFMSYMYGKFVNNPDDEDEENVDEDTQKQSINIDVWNKFMDQLSDKDLGFQDENADVRLSPRRLEQIILYVNAALPVSNEEDAINLMAFIRTNFSNYVDGEESKYLINKFSKIISELITETSDESLQIDMNSIVDKPQKASNWRSQLKHEIEMKIKLGDERKYVPVVSGQPGIGKTTEMAQLGASLNMGFIQIDVSNLTPEDITGMPIANMGDTITTEFSEPNLYITIMKEYNEKIKDFYQEGRKYNMVLLFDELNRSSVPVFNSIRKVLLEREFEHVKLPDDIIITGAINPNDVGAIEFTSHTRDVLDIIPSSGDFVKTMKYITTKKELLSKSDELGFNLLSAVSGILGQLANEFKSKIDSEGNDVNDVNVEPFWWSDGSGVFYVSPREMTEMVANAVNQVEDALYDMNWDINTAFEEKDYDQFIEEALNVTAKSFTNSFNMILLKQEIDASFVKTLGMKIVGNDKFKKMFEIMRTKKSAHLINLVEILRNADGDINFLDKGVIGEYIKDFSSSELIQDVASITSSYFDLPDPLETLEKTLAVFDRINKSLIKLDASNNYTDQLKKYIGGKLASLLKSGRIDILELAKNDKMTNKIVSLTS